MRIWTYIGDYFIFVSCVRCASRSLWLFQRFYWLCGVRSHLNSFWFCFMVHWKKLMHFFCWMIVLELKLAVYYWGFLLSFLCACAHTLVYKRFSWWWKTCKCQDIKNVFLGRSWRVCSLELFLHSHSLLPWKWTVISFWSIYFSHCSKSLTTRIL